jgi:conjugal transfer mating pair stabilization protein TraN
MGNNTAVLTTMGRARRAVQISPVSVKQPRNRISLIPAGNKTTAVEIQPDNALIKPYCFLENLKPAGRLVRKRRPKIVVSISSGASAEQYGKMKAIYAVLAAAKAGAAAIAAGTSAGAAVQQSLASSLDPASFAISASIYLTMSYLAKACGQTDMETAIMKDSGLCVEVGTYCSEEWKPFGCVQKKTTYCCFNSKIARIFHQQGRSQLTSFNKTQLFGNTESPDCRGYTSEEFSVLDFDRINLDEYINGINNKQKTNGLNEQLTRKTQQLEQQL